MLDQGYSVPEASRSLDVGETAGREHTLLKILESINIEQPRQRQCNREP